MDSVSLIGTFFALIPILLIALVLRWIRILRVNSEIQIEQNKQIIALLKDIANKN
ncbi:hypothetical protein [Ureibacillus acetophenoni]|uniref:Uncharacterized protein n=1 Tax=Ureibacillus acetophenoni TaxID=614649 RepID=A0A285UII8_9BACL|nr:hypothetical protein [Ureibacillus acetophenoni]SOC41593.1 hypothetical protein SAMN05877842_110182 [Ureibacillus acetophenoni]